MKKKIFILFLILTIFLCTIPAVYADEILASGICGSDLEWELTNDGVLTISGAGEMEFVGSAPWDSYSDKIHEVHILSGVTTIAESAFEEYSNLKKVILSDTILKIGRNSFYRCENLEEVNLPYGLTEIDYRAFYSCFKLSGNLDIPETVSKIGIDAFASCSSLTSVNIPSSLTELKYDYWNPFHGCSNLTSIHVSENNPNYSSDEYGVLYNKEKTSIITCPAQLSGEYHIPNSVTSIGGTEFYDCSNITAIYIPSSVTKIVGGNGVYGSSFNFCSSLTHFFVEKENPNYSSDPYGVLFNKDQSILIECPKQYSGIYQIPDSVSTVSINAFFGCSGLTQITVPASVLRMEMQCLYDCENLETVFFEGNAPSTSSYMIDSDYIFYGWDSFTAYYPINNDTWTEEARNAYGGDVTWKPYDPTVSFSDITKDQWFYSTVRWAVAEEITNGMGNGQFQPNTICTRAQVVSFLWKAAGQPEPSSTENPFTDVGENAWFHKAVLWAVEQGITTGTSATTFSPNDPCTRGQVVTFLWRYGGQSLPSVTESSFPDIQNGFYYYTPVLWAVEEGITTGMDDGSFAPNASCTRAQIVTFLYRYLN